MKRLVYILIIAITWCSMSVDAAGPPVFIIPPAATDTIPTMSGKSGQVLTNNGLSPSWTSSITATMDDSAAQFTHSDAATAKAGIDVSGVTASKTAWLKPVCTDNCTLSTPSMSGNGTLCEIDASQTLTTKTLTSPVINTATGSGGKFTGDLTGLAPSQLIHVACNTDDAGSSSASFHCATLAGVTNQLVGMTVYNTTDGSSCTITANDDHTITCTLAGGTANHWDSGNAMAIGPGPSQSGSFFYLDSAHAQTLIHPTTAGYAACYMAEGTVQITIDFAATMGFVGVVDSAVETPGDGKYVRSSGSTTDDYMCIHNRSTTVAKGLGKRGTWSHE